MFLRNEWYVAALSRELTDRPLQRVLLGEPLALFRTASGKATALHDRCPHRGAPLSTGEVVGESLVCGYHGFSFDPTGRCNHIPGGVTIPAKACVRSFPVIDRWGWIFVWMGDAALADEALLPDFRWMTEPGWAGDSDYLHVKSNYTLVRDNLLDLTHARFVHKKTLATAAVTETPIQTSVDNRLVRVKRDMLGIEPSPFFKRIPGFNRPLKKCSSNAPGSRISKKRVAQTRLRNECEGHFGLFAGRFARFGRTYPMAHA